MEIAEMVISEKGQAQKMYVREECILC